MLTCRNKAIAVRFSCTPRNAQRSVVSHGQRRKIMHGRSLAMEISKAEIGRTTSAGDVAQYRHGE